MLNPYFSRLNAELPGKIDGQGQKAAMTGTVSKPGGFLFRDARPMLDGRILIRSGQSFLIMESEEVRRLQSLLIASMAIDLLCGLAIVIAFALSTDGTVSDADFWTVVWIGSGIMVLTALIIGPYFIFNVTKRTQPADDNARLQDIWSGAGQGGGR